MNSSFSLRPKDGAPWIVTATPPTPNGDLHVGHLSGPYFAADVFARGRSLHEEKTIYVSSSDANQTYVVTTAERKGELPNKSAKSYHDEITKTLNKSCIGLDAYNFPDESHEKHVQDFFIALYDGGAFKEREVEALFDPVKNRYLFESFVYGYCPFCMEQTNGSICESCGHPNNPATLIEPKIVGNEGNLEKRSLRQLFLPVELYRDRIAAFYESRMGYWRPHLINLVAELLKTELVEYPVTYPLDWGIPVKINGWEGHVWNVWAEMLPGLMHSTALATKTVDNTNSKNNYWVEENGGCLVQFLGFDNSYFFAVAHLALLFAVQDNGLQNFLKPSFIITNEFFRLENRKFSSSKNHAIWGNELLSKYNPDSVRFYLALANPEYMQTNFTEQEMKSVLETDLLNTWKNLCAALEKAIQKVGMPSSSVDSDKARNIFKHRISLFQTPERFSVRDQAETCLSFFHYITDKLNNLTDGNELNSAWKDIATLMVGLYPIMPQFSESILNTMGVKLPTKWKQISPSSEIVPLSPNALQISKDNKK